MVETPLEVKVSVELLPVGPTEVELPPVTGEPSVEEVDDSEYVPTRESLLKLRENEAVTLGGP